MRGSDSRSRAGTRFLRDSSRLWFTCPEWNGSRRRCSVPRRAVAFALAAAFAIVVAVEGGQLSGASNFTPIQPDLHADAAAAVYDGGFRFCRFQFRTSLEGDGAGWYVDYPRADENLSLRLSQLTNLPLTIVGEGDPVHLVVRLTDAELFQCPFVMMTEPGGADLDETEAAQLRTYLMKGGFLWADDFWGSRAWEWWSSQMAKVLPPEEYPIVDVPLDHPMFHTLFDINEIPQIPNVGLWETEHRTSERGIDSAEAHARAIVDKKGRVMVFMTFNTDFGDAFEREGESPDYFLRFSVPAYEIAADVLVYALTH